MMEQLPYGANIIVSSISSSISEKYSINQPDFITSTKEISTITYSYIEKNGTLIGIDTNLQLTLDTNNKTFTLSNSNIFGTETEPYIKLLCNDVKIPISFIDYDNSGNKWYNAEYSSEYNPNKNTITLKGYYTGDYVKVIKYYTINWNTNENQKIFIEKSVSGGGIYAERYACKAYYEYLDDNNNIQSGESLITYIGYFPDGDKAKINIPKLNGESSTLTINNGNDTITKKFINYFALGIQVHFNDGYSVYKCDTINYTDTETRVYTNEGFLEYISGINYLEHNHGIPTKHTELEFKWNSDFFYKIQDSEYYISPSSSEIKYNWDFASSCNGFCANDCYSDGGGDDTGTITYWKCSGMTGSWYYDSWDDIENNREVAGIYDGLDPANAYERKHISSYYYYNIDGKWVYAGDLTAVEKTEQDDCGGCPNDDYCEYEYCDCDDECPYNYPCPNNVACPQFQGDWCDPYYYDCPTDY